MFRTEYTQGRVATEGVVHNSGPGGFPADCASRADKLSPKPGSTDGLGLRGANTTNQVPF